MRTQSSSGEKTALATLTHERGDKTRMGKSGGNAPLLQEKTEISLSRALLVPEGVPRAPSL